jgi:hypothetical protein
VMPRSANHVSYPFYGGTGVGEDPGQVLDTLLIPRSTIMATPPRRAILWRCSRRWRACLCWGCRFRSWLCPPWPTCS